MVQVQLGLVGAQDDHRTSVPHLYGHTVNINRYV
jgi:hypothetical protein